MKYSHVAFGNVHLYVSEFVDRDVLGALAMVRYLLRIQQLVEVHLCLAWVQVLIVKLYIII